MADLNDYEIEEVLEGTPDLSDIVLAIINVETREGRQLSFSMYPVQDEKMSATVTDEEHGRENVMSGDLDKPVRVIPRRRVHTFTVTVEEKL